MNSWRDGTILVTGGGGFIGGAIVRRLRSVGLKVRSVSRSRYDWLDDFEVEQVQGDLADRATVRKALQGCSAVFHVAALADLGSAQTFHRSNVLATQNLLAGCRELNVTRFVFTSSPSVAQTDQGCSGGDEQQPIPETHRTFYQATKAESERMVLAAYCESLRTVALRPRLVWGPGDPHLLPRLVERSHAGRLALVGDGELAGRQHLHRQRRGCAPPRSRCARSGPLALCRQSLFHLQRRASADGQPDQSATEGGFCATGSAARPSLARRRPRRHARGCLDCGKAIRRAADDPLPRLPTKHPELVQPCGCRARSELPPGGQLG